MSKSHNIVFWKTTGAPGSPKHAAKFRSDAQCCR
jgi:hypothetical protein